MLWKLELNRRFCHGTSIDDDSSESGCQPVSLWQNSFGVLPSASGNFATISQLSDIVLPREIPPSKVVLGEADFVDDVEAIPMPVLMTVVGSELRHVVGRAERLATDERGLRSYTVSFCPEVGRRLSVGTATVNSFSPPQYWRCCPLRGIRH